MESSLTQCIDNVLKDADYENNPYFVNLRNGQFEKEDFLETQIQFYYAVDFFPRPMAALAAKIPTHELRLEVLHNVFEEHGEGEKKKFHKFTFLTLLQRLANISQADVDRRALWPEVRHFNTTLAGVCVLDEYIVGTGVLGIIERMFVDISAWIGEGIIGRQWLKEEQLIHYNLHKELDIKHAQDFFRILEEPWKESEKNRYYIRQGLLLGSYCFNSMYEGLYRSRKRRELVDEASSL